MTQIITPTTKEQVISYSIPETFLFVAGTSVQSGPHSIEFSLSWLSDDADIVKLAMGNFIDVQYEDSPSQFRELSMLLLHPDETAPSSIYIPRCYAVKAFNPNYSKNNPTQLSIKFFFQDRNRFNRLFYKRTPDDLVSIMGSKSPL